MYKHIICDPKKEIRWISTDVWFDYLKQIKKNTIDNDLM